MALFKYYPPHRSSMLDGPYVRFSPATEFKDPFDGVPILRNFDGAAITRTRYEYAVRKSYQDELSKRPRPMTLSDFQREHFPLEKFVALQKKNMPKYVRQFYKRYEEVRQIGGVLSLCRNGMSAAMWSHYAENQRGFLVEFDDSHEFFQQFKRPDFGAWLEIKYDDRRPEFDYETGEVDEVLGFKSPEWAYEQEVRLVRLLNKQPLGEADNSGRPTLFRVPHAAVVSVTLGANTLADTRTALDQALKSNEMSHVQRCHAVSDHQSYAVLREAGWD